MRLFQSLTYLENNISDVDRPQLKKLEEQQAVQAQRVLRNAHFAS